MVVVSAVRVTVLQILLSVLAIVFNVLVLVKYIAVQQMMLHVLAIVVFVLVLIQNITVQEVMAFAQIQFLHVPAQAVAQYGIVRHVLMIHMVYADIQHVAAILAAKHMIMGYTVQLVRPVVAALVV